MGRGSAKGSSPKKKQGGRKAPAKRRVVPKRAVKFTTKAATPHRSSSKSKPEAAELAAELKAAQTRQAATSEILRIISRSPADAQPVFEAIVLAAVRLLGCDLVYFLRCDAATFSTAAIAGPKGLLKSRSTAPVPLKWFVRNDPFPAVNPSPAFDKEIALGPQESFQLAHRVVFADRAWERPEIEAFAAECGL